MDVSIIYTNIFNICNFNINMGCFNNCRWIPDSPRWHLNKQNIQKVKHILENSLAVNRRDNKAFPNMEDLIKEQSLTAQVRYFIQQY